MRFAWTTAIRPFVRSAVLLAGLGTASCRWMQTGDPTVLQPTATATVLAVGDCASACTDSVDVVSLGVSGFLVVPARDTTRLVLTPPLFTSPTVKWLVFGDLLVGTHADTARITRRLAALPAVAPRLSRVAAVLVGHGHYDHLMDLPALMPRMPHAVVYGSSTVTNLLAPVPSLSADRRLVVDSLAGVTAQLPGRSVVVSSAIRVRPIRWAHAPNFATFTIAPGHQRTPRGTLPRTVHGWKMGTPYAWVMDVLARDSSVAWRLLYHDAAAGADVQRRAAEVIGTMPPARHTALIATAANFDQLPLYPDILLAHLAPQHVLLSHWDDFFRSSEKPERVVRGIRARDLITRLGPYVGSHWSAPRAGAVTRFRW